MTKTPIRAPPQRLAARRSRIKVPAVSLAVALVWYVAATIAFGREDAKNDEAAIDIASRAFAERVEQDQARIRNECEYLSEDPRFKGMLAKEIDSPSIDAFVRHVADQVVRRSLVAILAPDARVIAASSGNLKGGDFAKTAAVKAALASKGTFTGVWSLDGTIVNVAVRTITLGDQILAVLVVGAAVDDELLRDVERVSTVRGAVAVGPNILASSGSVEDFRPHIDIAAGQTVRRGNFVVRTERIAPRAAGARAVWRCAATNGTKRGVILLFPVVAAFGFGVMQARRMDGGF